MTEPEILERARESFDRHAWRQAYTDLTASDSRSPLSPHDLELLATAAYLCGQDLESRDVWARAHQAFLAESQPVRAARCAFWLAFTLLNHGEKARASGWLARAARLLDESGGDCAERGYLLVPGAIRHIMTGDAPAGLAAFRDAVAIGERFGDADLITLARHGQGRALLRMGEVEAGLSLMDEAMAAIEAEEVSALVAGNVYCSTIEACQEIFDLRRAREWTSALTRWCESQPELVPYRGQCLVRRAEILQLEGAWPDAMEEARRACEQLTRPPGEPAAGAAFYQVAELHRLSGEFAQAEAAYQEASGLGRSPQPGLAELRLAQGRADAAAAAIGAALAAARGHTARSRLLPAYVEIMLELGELDAASDAADELAGIAMAVDAPLLHALARRARGAVLLKGHDAAGALEALREACGLWQQLDAPHEAARTRVLMGLACRELGDEDGGELELAAARAAFQELGAAPDLARLDGLVRPAPTGRSHGLTPRELEVLRLLAAGRTNKAIARELRISQRTAERHVSNILAKLDVASRAAATSYAYQHQLV